MHNLRKVYVVLIRFVKEKLTFAPTKLTHYAACNIKHVQKSHGVVVIISYLIKLANHKNTLLEVTKSSFIRMVHYVHIKFNFRVDQEKVINFGFILTCYITLKLNLS